jgi:hypothetical protein
LQKKECRYAQRRKTVCRAAAAWRAELDALVVLLIFPILVDKRLDGGLSSAVIVTEGLRNVPSSFFAPFDV